MIWRLKAAAVGVAILLAGAAIGVHAQNGPRRLMVKSGESIEIGTVYYVSQCRSIMIGMPELEVLEGPSEVSLSIREEPVLPRTQGCAKKIAGGTIVLTAKSIAEPSETKLAYRVNYKTRDGDRQTSRTYLISLYP